MTDAREALARVTAWLDDDSNLRIPDTPWGKTLYDDLRLLVAGWTPPGEGGGAEHRAERERAWLDADPRKAAENLRAVVGAGEQSDDERTQAGFRYCRECRVREDDEHSHSRPAPVVPDVVRELDAVMHHHADRADAAEAEVERLREVLATIAGATTIADAILAEFDVTPRGERTLPSVEDVARTLFDVEHRDLDAPGRAVEWALIKAEARRGTFWHRQARAVLALFEAAPTAREEES